MRVPDIDPFTEAELKDAIRQTLVVLNDRDRCAKWGGIPIPESELVDRGAALYMAITGNFAGHCPRCRTEVAIRAIEDVTQPLPMANARPTT
ncbi:MAG: hypothetical protein ABJA82_09735 [Myxococcales bacterium]